MSDVKEENERKRNDGNRWELFRTHVSSDSYLN